MSLDDVVVASMDLVALAASVELMVFLHYCRAKIVQNFYLLPMGLIRTVAMGRFVLVMIFVMVDRPALRDKLVLGTLEAVLHLHQGSTVLAVLSVPVRCCHGCSPEYVPFVVAISIATEIPLLRLATFPDMDAGAS